MTNSFATYSRENGGRVLLLFLLFCLAIYQLMTSGLQTFAIVCIIPVTILYIYVTFKWRMFSFWALITINYFLQMKDIGQNLPIPMSLPNEMFELILLAIAIIDARKDLYFNRAINLMLLALMIWTGLCLIELLNDSCSLGIDVGKWFTGFRLMAVQLVWILLVFSIYISSPKILLTYLKIWALFSLFSVFWVWKQKTFGFTAIEQQWIETRGRQTHILNAGTLTRYFSTFSDAANYGCHAAAAAVAFIIIGITNNIKKAKFFFLTTAILVIWGMFQSGTRTAIICIGAGLVVYIFLSKSIKIAIPFSVMFVIFALLLIFTSIGNSNQQIRRMRSAFNKDDASASVRDINKTAIKKYMKDIPWGIGLGMSSENIPTNNKFYKLSAIPPDSEYVFIWVRTGPIGVSIFTFCMLLIFVGGCSVVLFKLHNKSLLGIGAGLCCAFVSINLGGYANQVLYQYPNGITYFGGMAIVYILPYLEPEWDKYEKMRIAQIEESKRLKLEKKLAKRV
jgi:hypothetical protein